MLRLWLSLTIDFEGDIPTPLPNLDFKIVCGDSLAAPDPSLELAPELFSAAIRPLAAHIAHLKREYMAAVAARKASLREMILTKRSEVARLIGGGSAPNNAVDWQLEFVDIFAERGGFDISIANPPYVSAIEFTRTREAGYRDYLKSIYRSTKGAWDLFVPFFERSVQLLNAQGTLCFITPNKYLSAPYAKELRTLLLSRGSILLVADVSRIRIFPSASVHPVITAYGKGTANAPPVSVMLPSCPSEVFHPSEFSRYDIDRDTLGMLPDNIWGFLLSPHIDLLRKIIRGASKLGDLGRVQATSTAAESDEYGSHLVDQSASNHFKVVNTGLIDPYDIKWGEHRFIHAGERYETPYLPRSVVSGPRSRLYSTPKVLFAKLAKRPEAALDAAGEYAGLNINCFHSPRHDVSLELVAAFCNSSVFQFVYGQFFGALRMGPSYQFQAPQLRVIPFLLPDARTRKEIECLVAKIYEEGSVSVETLMKDIDRLFFQSYQLSLAEVAELLHSISHTEQLEHQ